MKLFGILLLFASMCFPSNSGYSQSTFDLSPAAAWEDWPEGQAWWKRNNLRVMQTNLPAYEGALNVEHLIESLQRFSVNTLIINGGGIMAFYPTELDFQYTNPYMERDMLGEVIRRCHQVGIRVITRFDFSRIHRSIFEKHPDWCYISPKGERIINDDLYMTAINAPYVQAKSIEIVKEVLEKYPIDGIFINMPGYRTNNAYKGTYHGIDQNPYDRERFKQYSGGLKLPIKEDAGDTVFQIYQDFKAYTADDWMKNIQQVVKAQNPKVAICTYQEKYVDIIRHESLTRGLPYWPYMSFDNVTNTMTSQPKHIVSNASIQQISFRSRFNAIGPEETAIRLYQNIAAGSGLDMSMMGDFEGYEDPRNFDIWEKIYAHHKKYEAYYGKYQSSAEICVISPSYWPGGKAGEEYRGIQLILKEAHLQYDIIMHREIAHLPEKISQYKLVLIPQITDLHEAAIETLENALKEGTHIIATNQTLIGQPKALKHMFGAEIHKADNPVDGNYLVPEDPQVFKRLSQQRLVHWKFNLGLYDFSEADRSLLPIYTPGRPGPPEKTGGHEPTGYYSIGLKTHQKGKAVLMPLNIGRLYYQHGYAQHKHILLDIIDEVFPSAYSLLQTNAHERIDVTLQHFTKNLPGNMDKKETDGMVLHLVNMTGFSGNAYFSPLMAHDLQFRIRSDFQPRVIYSMAEEKEIPFKWEEGYILFDLGQLGQYDGLIIEK